VVSVGAEDKLDHDWVVAVESCSVTHELSAIREERQSFFQNFTVFVA
jgi:hypothetical protein